MSRDARNNLRGFEGSSGNPRNFYARLRIYRSPAVLVVCLSPELAKNQEHDILADKSEEDTSESMGYGRYIGKRFNLSGPCFPTASCLLALLVILSAIANGQTSCSIQHAEVGAFVCAPERSAGGEDSSVASIFHLSAQGNALPGESITRYAVLIDNRRIYENKLYSPVQRLSIETNLKSPFDSGLHALQLIMDGASSTEAVYFKFYPARGVSFCNPFSRFDGRSCILSSTRGALDWSLEERDINTLLDPISGYFAYAQLYAQNLKSVEADASDVMALDSRRDLYVASHQFSEVELRRYAIDGSITYDSLIHSCGNGYLSVVGLAIDGLGRAWIAGNTNACLLTTPGSIETTVSDRMRGFLMMIDTTMPSSNQPLYVTYLSNEESRITAIRLDSQGNAYITGTTSSQEFPHGSSLMVSKSSSDLSATAFSFVSMLRPLSSTFAWSTLLPNTRMTALALDTRGNVYVTGRVAVNNLGFAFAKVLVAELSDGGRRLSYSSQFGGSGNAEARAISIDAQGSRVIVMGDTEAPGSPTHARSSPPFIAVLQPCQGGILHFQIGTFDGDLVPAMVFGWALDSFASSFDKTGAAEFGNPDATSPIATSFAPTCPPGKP
jgi:hypothetical protein